MKKIKKKMLFLAILSISSLSVVASCSVIKQNNNSEFVDKEKQKEIDKDKKRREGEIINPVIPKEKTIGEKLKFKIENRIKIQMANYKFSADINNKRDDFGVIKNVDELKSFLNLFGKKDPNFIKTPNVDSESNKQNFISYAENKYNKDFFKNYDMVFWYVISPSIPNQIIIDNATLKHDTLTINAVYLTRLDLNYFINKPVSPAFESRINFAIINKNEYKYNKIEINRIDTLEKFKAYSSKDFEGNYSKEDSIELNKEFNTYKEI